MGESVASGYRAFISYSHVDTAAARQVHRALEGYRLPRRLVGTPTSLGPVPRRLTPIFRDRDELPASNSLSQQIQDALSQSAALIVLCSPAARNSEWVAREIMVFREQCPDRPILTALIEGEPAEAFPDSLLTSEPIAADFRKGHDGARAAQLKLVAGLTGVGLDALVQRDTQRQLRRVTAITLGAVAGMVAMGLLLVLALNARREAERQRSEAEGLVEFMLTDLRTKLKGVGRLDVMGTVNARAIGYYDQQGLGSLSDESLERRARVLHAMGEDDIAAGNYDSALARFQEAHATTEASLRRHPDNPDAIFTHAQSEYWVGHVFELRREWPAALQHFEQYAEAGKRLIAIEPGNADYMMERGWGALNRGVTQVRAQRDLSTADALLREAITWFERAAKVRPKDDGPKLEMGNALAWLADGLAARTLWADSLTIRRKQLTISEDLYRADPENRDRIFKLANVERAVALLSSRLKDRTASAEFYAKSYAHARALVTSDPHNADWLLLRTKIECEMLRGIAPVPPEIRVNAVSDRVAAAVEMFRRQRNPKLNDLSSCPGRSAAGVLKEEPDHAR